MQISTPVSHVNEPSQQYDQQDVTDQEILRKIRQLNPREATEVLNFIDFLLIKQPERHPLMQLLADTAGPEIELAALRNRLNKISGTMAAQVRKGRDERI